MARFRPINADVQTVLLPGQRTRDASKKRRATPAKAEHRESFTFVNTIGPSMHSSGRGEEDNGSTMQQRPGEYGSAHDTVNSSADESTDGRHSELRVEAIAMETGPSSEAPHFRYPASVSVMQRPVRLTSIRSTIEGSDKGPSDCMLGSSKRARTEERDDSSPKRNLRSRWSSAEGDARTRTQRSSGWYNRTGEAARAIEAVADTQRSLHDEHRLTLTPTSTSTSTPASTPIPGQTDRAPLVKCDSGNGGGLNGRRQLRQSHCMQNMSQQAGDHLRSTPGPATLYETQEGREAQGIIAFGSDEESILSPKTDVAEPYRAERAMHRSYHNPRLLVPVNATYPAVAISSDDPSQASETSDEEEDKSDRSDRSVLETACESGKDQNTVSLRGSTTEGRIMMRDVRGESQISTQALVDDNENGNKVEQENKNEDVQDSPNNSLPPAAELYEVVFEDEPVVGRRVRRRNAIKPMRQATGQMAKPWTSLTSLEVASYDDEEEEDQQTYRLGDDVYICTTEGKREPARILDIRDLDDGRQILAILWLYRRTEALRHGLRAKDWPADATHVLTNWLQIVLWNTIQGPFSSPEVKVAKSRVLNVGAGPARLLTDERHEVAWTRWTKEHSEKADEG